MTGLAAELFAPGEWVMVQRFVERTVGHGFKLAVIEAAAPRDRELIIQTIETLVESGAVRVALEQLPGENLWQELRARLAGARIAMLWGLDDASGLARDRLIRQLNVQRDLFVRDIGIPWVLFVHPAAALELRMLAPDFCDFALIWLSASPSIPVGSIKMSPVLSAAAEAIQEGRMQDAAALLSRHEQRLGLSQEERAQRSLLQARVARLQHSFSEADGQLARARELAPVNAAIQEALIVEKKSLDAMANLSSLVYLLAAPEDLSLLKELEDQLKPLQARGLLRIFADYHIPPGAITGQIVRANLEDARLIVPLLSAGLLSSMLIAPLIDRALERQTAQEATVVPVLLKPCMWQYSALAQSRALPSDGQPVTVWRDRNAAWNDVVLGLLTALGIGAPAPPSVRRPETPVLAAQDAPQPATPVERHALLLVAVATESRALMEELGAQQITTDEDDRDGRYLDTFALPNRNGAFRVIIGQSNEIGSQAAQSLVQDLVRAYHPEVVLLVGMCGGLAEHGARNNAVLVARQVFSYESARLREGRAPWSPTPYRASARVTDLVNALLRRDALLDLDVITNKDFGSGEKLIDDLGSELRQRILTLADDIVGVEMEGHGMLHSLWELQRSGTVTQAGLIEGISDLADGRQRDNEIARRTDATRRAVRLALEILRRF